MRTTATLILAAIFTLVLTGSKVCGQVVAIGHVTAEVIESISAASNAVTSFEIGSVSTPDSKTLQQTYQASETIQLGAITLNSGSKVTCNVVVKPAILSDSAGNDFTLAPEAKNSSFAMTAQPNGAQTIQLAGITNMDRSQASGLYQGSYTVVFAYN